MSARSSLKRRETEHSRDRQQQMLFAIAVFTRQHGYAPTLRELGALVGMRTPSAVRWQLDRLRAAGLVDWRDGASRTLRLTGKAAQS